jgi:hypothetical protein
MILEGHYNNALAIKRLAVIRARHAFFAQASLDELAVLPGTLFRRHLNSAPRSAQIFAVGIVVSQFARGGRYPCYVG